MRRRHLLASVAAVGLGSLAGCAGSSDDGDGATREAVEERIDDAAGYLETNQEAFRTFGESDETPDTFDAGAIERRVDDAVDELDEAEGDASGESLDRIESLRAIGEFQLEAAEFNERFVDWSACLQTAESYIDVERLEDAATELEECDASFQELDDQYERTRDAFEEIDPDQLDEDTRLEYRDGEEEFVVGRQELDSVDALTDGLATFVDALVRFSEGSDALDGERWADAEAAFEEARTEFQQSADTLADLESDTDTPEQMRPDVIEFHCGAEALAEASGEFADGAAAADRGDARTAQDHFEAGGEAAERCD